MKRGTSSKPGRRLAAIDRAEQRAQAYCAELRAAGVVPTVAALLQRERWLFLWDAERIIHQDQVQSQVSGTAAAMDLQADEARG